MCSTARGRGISLHIPKGLQLTFYAEHIMKHLFVTSALVTLTTVKIRHSTAILPATAN